MILFIYVRKQSITPKGYQKTRASGNEIYIASSNHRWMCIAKTRKKRAQWLLGLGLGLGLALSPVLVKDDTRAVSTLVISSMQKERRSQEILGHLKPRVETKKKKTNVQEYFQMDSVGKDDQKSSRVGGIFNDV